MEKSTKPIPVFVKKIFENHLNLLTKNAICVILTKKNDRGAPQEEYFLPKACAGVAKTKGLGAEGLSRAGALWQLG